MTTRTDTTADVLGRAPPHIPSMVEAAHGPLVGPGRLRRVSPFAATWCLSAFVAVPSTTWVRPEWALAAGAGVALTIVVTVMIPWMWVSRRLQLIPPMLLLVATLILMTSAGPDDSSAFVVMTVVPLIWLAISERRRVVISIGTLTGISVLLLAPGRHAGGWIHVNTGVVVLVVCAAGMGAALHRVLGGTRQVAQALRNERDALERAALMLDVLPDHVSRYRVADHVVTYCNQAWATQYRTSPADAVGRPLEEFLSDDEFAGLFAQLAILGPDNPVVEDVAPREVAHSPGQWLHWIDRYMQGDDGDEILSIGRDVTARRTAEAQLAASEAGYRDLADKSADVVWRVKLEPTPHFDYMSPSVEDILGYPASYFLEDFSRMLEVLDETSTTAISRAINGERVLGQFDFHIRRPDGTTIIGETRTTSVPGGLQGVSRDVTDLRQLQDSVAALALRDPLTGLANRRLLEELLDADLARTERHRLPLAVAFLDLDGFKHVNDEHGHSAGDVVLRETARRLLGIVRSADTVARVGGDEFVIVYEPTDSTAENLIEHIDQALSEPIQIAPNIAVRCPASIGIVEAGSVGYERSALLAGADRAMYEMKRTRTLRSIDVSD